MKTRGYGEEGRGAQRSPRPLERQLEDTDTRSASRLEVWGDMGRYGEIWGDTRTRVSLLGGRGHARHAREHGRVRAAHHLARLRDVS